MLALQSGASGTPVFSRDPLTDVLFDGWLGWSRLLGDWVPYCWRDSWNTASTLSWNALPHRLCADCGGR
jgi:hypothetical protein